VVKPAHDWLDKNPMPEESLKQLRARASMSLRNSDFDEAFAAYRELQQRDPGNPIWCQRRAEIYEQIGDDTGAIKNFARARSIALENGDIIFAIAVCKQILSLDPDDVATHKQMQRLCDDANDPSNLFETPGTKIPRSGDDAALEEILLTDMVAGARPMASNQLETSGIIEIPLTEDVQAEGLPVPGTREQLQNTPLFGSLDSGSLRDLMQHAKIVSLDEGEVLFRQGDHSETLYVVTDGAVVPIAEEDPPKKLAVLEAGEFFGEIGLMTDRPRNATIQAMVETRLLAIDRKAMWALIRKNPKVLDVMLCFLRDRLVDRLMRTNPLFAAFPANQRPSLAKLFRLIEVRDGSTLVDQGRQSENLFALLAGSAQVIQMGIDSDKVLAELEPGCIFGEMSMLNDTPAVAAVVTRSKCWVLALSRTRLDRLRIDNPKIEEVIKGIAAERQHENANLHRDGSEPGRPQ
jgi:cAMP-dependent protein kinase regulator